MQNFYHELFFKVGKQYEKIFLDFIFDLGIEAIEEKDGGIYIRSNDNLEDFSWGLKLLAQKLSSKLAVQNLNFDIILYKKENKDWVEEYKKGIQPILINQVYIHTTWQEPKKKYLNVKINPALAFGSGHHESTHSCIKLLQKFAKKDMKALDLGCGSGILAIILAQLGCKVDACDTDELAVDSTLSNVKLNQVKLQNIWQGSLEKTKNKYEFIVVNIIADVIFILEKEIKKHLKENAILILSGILNKYETRVKEKFQDLKLVESLKFNEWTSLVYQKKEK